jgi:malonyl CoA-acyl carrier protein transacylase
VVIICITILLALGKSSDTLTSFIVAVPGALATAFGVYTALKTQKISVNVNGHLSALAAAAGIMPVQSVVQSNGPTAPTDGITP